MSLLNDALKRAEKARPENFPAGPALQPVTLSSDVSRSRRSPGLIFPILIFLTLVLAGFFLWQWYSGVTMVKARTTPAPVPVTDEIKPKPQPSVPSPKPTQPAAAAPAKAVPIASSLTSTISNAITNLIAAVSNKPVGNAYRLQSIFFRPASPAAVINGEMVFVGDKLNGATVTAIGTNSARIVTPDGKTQNLELP